MNSNDLACLPLLHKLSLIIALNFVFSGCFQSKKNLVGNTNDLPKPQGIWATEWSSDGKYFALGGDDSTLWIYEASDYSLYKSYKLNSMLRGLSWHPKENLLAVSSMRGVQLLNMKTLQLKTIPDLKDGGRGIGWNHTGELLALAGGGIVTVMNKEGKLIRSIPKHNNNSYLALDWHPTKDIIVTASDEIILFDTSGKQLQFIKHRKENTGVLSVKWHPSGEFFASGDYGHEKEGKPTILQFWKEDGTLLKTITGHHAEIRNLRWNKGGSRLATASDALRIWSKGGELLYTGESKEILWGIAWSPDNKNIVTGSFENGKVKLWNSKATFIKEIN